MSSLERVEHLLAGRVVPKDAYTAAEEAADVLADMHTETAINLHLAPTLAAFVRAWHGGFERDETDEADDHHSERADQEAWT